MTSKVRVFGTAQNRTVQGIFNAYLIMYPHATLEDLNKAFPKELHHGNNPIFVDIKDASKYTKVTRSGEKKGEEESNFDFIFLTQKSDIFCLKDGTKAVMLQMWVNEWFDNVVKHAKQYGIEVADFKPREPMKKGSYRLEYLNGYIPPIPEKQKSKLWIWILLAILVIGIILFFLLKKDKEPVIVEKIVEKEIIVRDTVYLQQLQEIEKNFNAAQFVAGKADLSEDAKFVLHDLAKLLKSNPELKLRIVGHTSKEGTEEFNQKLSEARAKAAVDFLVNERGVEAVRLEYKGVGSSQPIDETKLDINRRTEFIVINK
jgi:outer membrane protein OmpA-like peptidoglycan-associated protein